MFLISFVGGLKTVCAILVWLKLGVVLPAGLKLVTVLHAGLKTQVPFHLLRWNWVYVGFAWWTEIRYGFVYLSEIGYDFACWFKIERGFACWSETQGTGLPTALIKLGMILHAGSNWVRFNFARWFEIRCGFVSFVCWGQFNKTITSVTIVFNLWKKRNIALTVNRQRHTPIFYFILLVSPKQ